MTWRGVRAYERRGVLVTTLDGRQFHGVLKHFWRRDGLVLMGASGVDDRGGYVPIAGDFFIPIGNLSGFQEAPVMLKAGDA